MRFILEKIRSLHRGRLALFMTIMFSSVLLLTSGYLSKIPDILYDISNNTYTAKKINHYKSIGKTESEVRQEQYDQQQVRYQKKKAEGLPTCTERFRSSNCAQKPGEFYGVVVLPGDYSISEHISGFAKTLYDLRGLFGIIFIITILCYGGVFIAPLLKMRLSYKKCFVDVNSYYTLMTQTKIQRIIRVMLC